MTTIEGLTIIAIILGPAIGVGITIWSNSQSKIRDQQRTVLRMLLATHHLPSDPNYQIAINLIPIEFRSSKAVMAAHKEFIEAVGRKLDGVNDDEILKNWSIKSVRLVHEVAKALKYDLKETDLQTVPYSSQGWGNREALLMDSQRAMREIANVLAIQTRMLGGESLEDIKAVNLSKEKDLLDK